LKREGTIASKSKKAGAAKPQHKLHDLVMDMLDQDKGENIVSIDLAGKTSIADYMVVVTGKSSRQVAGMAEKLRAKLGTAGVKVRVEGQETGDWVIVDAGDVIVHLFRAEVREFYNLEKLWTADFSTVDYTLYQSQ
jgi:ribosome-associated protein